VEKEDINPGREKLRSSIPMIENRAHRLKKPATESVGRRKEKGGRGGSRPLREEKRRNFKRN